MSNDSMTFNKRTLTLEKDFYQAILKVLTREGMTAGDRKMIAGFVQGLSNHYISGTPIGNIWANRQKSIGYLSYFLPLNYLRLTAIIEEGLARGFFSGIDHIFDFGSGPGTTHLAMEASGITAKTFACLDQSPQAYRWHKLLIEALETADTYDLLWLPQTTKDIALKPATLACMSYSLNELQELPTWLLEAEALMIVEPSTRDQGRSLLRARQQLIDSGYYLWAPCTHQLKCAMLSDSKHDWCHDRVFVEMPSEWKKMETYLRMENRSVTFSYLLARKSPPPAMTGAVRVIGDTLKEKGKTRQMVCRGSEREFLSWLKRNGPAQEIPRGSLIEIPEEHEKKGSEIRLQAPVSPVAH